MKHKIWLAQLPVILLTCAAFWVTSLGAKGELDHPVLIEKVFPHLRTFQGAFSNWKFQIRGPEKPKNKIVIVEVDDASLSDEKLGRWPWRRDKMARLIRSIVDAGAKVVGLDIVFSEQDVRIDENLKMVLEGSNMGYLVDEFETDPTLSKLLAEHGEKIILGWSPDRMCIPRNPVGTDLHCTHGSTAPTRAHTRLFSSLPLEGELFYTHIPDHFSKFALNSDQVIKPSIEAMNGSTINEIRTGVFVHEIFSNPAKHAGMFYVSPDSDGYVRRSQLLFTGDQQFYPTLPLKMAEVGLRDPIQVELDEYGTLKSLGFSKSGKNISTTASGAMEINFRGPAYTFQYVSARGIMQAAEGLGGELARINVSRGRHIASVEPGEALEMLKDAYVLIGVTALGVFDMRAFPFETNSPGVEGHAYILDNILSGDFMDSGRSNSLWLFLLLSLGAIAFAIVTERLQSIPALLLFMAIMTGMSFIDIQLLFANQMNWNTGLFYTEYFAIFVLTLAVKYVVEERNKKFIRDAFSKYVAPAVVDSILKDPAKLTVGGEKRDLTILFSDIRGFTTFSEKMDAKELAGFLNEYLGQMTDVVFETDGTLDKYIGDAVMAFWGAPIDQPQHASNALRAAREMQRKLAALRPIYKEKYGVDVQIGIGINSGTVNVGNMGSDRIFEYTVIGDHVNLASRLEGLTKPYHAGILTTRFTFDMISKAQGDHPAHRTLDFVKVKGKKLAVELIEIYEQDRKPAGTARFEEARKLYTLQKWDEAIAAFREAITLFKELDGIELDGPSVMYIERCEEFKKAPPGQDWDGSWEMHSK